MYEKHETAQTHLSRGASALNAGRGGSRPHAAWASEVRGRDCVDSLGTGESRVEFRPARADAVGRQVQDQRARPLGRFFSLRRGDLTVAKKNRLFTFVY